MGNLTIDELPTRYGKLARIRTNRINPMGDDLLSGLFIWKHTPEGHDFWEAVSDGEEPPLPAISLYHLIRQPIINFFT